MSLGGYRGLRPEGLTGAFSDMVQDGLSLVGEDVRTGEVIAMSVGAHGSAVLTIIATQQKGLFPSSLSLFDVY